MTTETRPRQTELCVVKSKAEADDGWKLELDIAAFESQYPTVVTRIPKELAVRLTVGKQYPLILERQNLKKGKTGNKPYDWYWGLVDIAKDAPTTPEEPPPDAGTGEGQQRYGGRDQSIERQVALKAATELAGYIMAKESARVLGTRDVILSANTMAQWLRTGIVPVPAPAKE